MRRLIKPRALETMPSITRLWIWPALAAGILAAQPASAAEWRYCLASYHSERTIYISQVFQTDRAMDLLQHDFAHHLDQTHRSFESIQCPRGEQQTIATLRLQAIRYNRDSGNAVIELGWPH